MVSLLWLATMGKDGQRWAGQRSIQRTAVCYIVNTAQLHTNENKQTTINNHLSYTVNINQLKI
jgi:hypothetical protein